MNTTDREAAVKCLLGLTGAIALKTAFYIYSGLLWTTAVILGLFNFAVLLPVGVIGFEAHRRLRGRELVTGNGDYVTAVISAVGCGLSIPYFHRLIRLGYADRRLYLFCVGLFACAIVAALGPLGQYTDILDTKTTDSVGEQE